MPFPPVCVVLISMFYRTFDAQDFLHGSHAGAGTLVRQGGGNAGYTHNDALRTLRNVPRLSLLSRFLLLVERRPLYCRGGSPRVY